MTYFLFLFAIFHFLFAGFAGNKKSQIENGK